MADNKTVRSITGDQTTAGAAEETMSLVVDGAAPAASVAVPSGTNLVITDVVLGALTSTSMWRIQQANDGVTWFDIALFNIPSAATTATPQHSFNTGLVVNGGALVAIRVRVETPGGASAAAATLRAYSES